MILTEPQTIALDYLEDDTTREVLFGGSAGPGKTTLGCYWQLKNRLKYPGSVGLLGRSTLKTLKETTLSTFHRVAKMQGIVFGSHYRLYADKELQFFNGSKILLKDLFYYAASDPDCDELGSLEITDAFIDEASQVHNTVKNVLKSRIRLKGIDGQDMLPKILYATNPGKNWTKTEFRDAAIKGCLPKDKKFVPALLDSNMHISKYYRENLLSLPPALRERLLGGNWEYSDDPTQLMKSQAINNIFTNVHVPVGTKYITADIARAGRDKVVIRVWSGWRVIMRKAYTKLKITESADKIREMAKDYEIPMHRVMVDEDGIGGGVVDILGCKGFIANARPSATYKNKNNFNFGSAKDQCGWYVAEKVNKGEVYENADVETQQLLSEELAQVKDAGLNKDGKNKLIGKDKISAELGRSPDDSDTYNLRAWFDLSVNYGPSIISPR